VIFLPETFAREVVSVYRNVSRRVTHAAVKASLKVAVRKHEDDGVNQLEETLLIDFLDEALCVFIQDEYLGPDWNALLCRDIIRFIANEHLSEYDPSSMFKISSAYSPANTSSSSTLPKMAFFDMSKLHVYPAVQEIVKSMHLIPAEINCKQIIN
jgi:hypothetical protein